MEQSIVIVLAIALILFVWVWIGLTIVQRLSLEQKIEKLENIENRLPEEERQLTHLKELRAIEQNKVGSAKLILGLFGLLLLVALGLGTFYTPVQNLFGLDNLKTFSYLAIVVLSFMVLPTFVGLTLAGSTKPQSVDKKEKAPAKDAA
jgi:small-conductance mechanosensitive channel